MVEPNFRRHSYLRNTAKCGSHIFGSDPVFGSDHRNEGNIFQKGAILQSHEQALKVTVQYYIILAVSGPLFLTSDLNVCIIYIL